MRVNAALGMLCLSLGIGLIPRVSRLARIVRKTLAIMVIIVATLTLTQYLFGWDLGIDEALLVAAMDGVSRFPGRMAPIAALCLLLIGLSLLMVCARSSRLRQIGQFIAFGTLVISFQAFVVYLFGISRVEGLGYYTQMAVHTGLALSLLSVALLTATRKDGLMHVIIHADVGGRDARRLVVAVFVIPPLFISLQLKGQSLGFFDADMSNLIRLLGDVTFFLVIVWRSASQLHTLDQERTAKEADFQFLTEAIPQLVWTADAGGRINFFTKRWNEYTGRELSPDFNMLDLTHPDDCVNARENWQRVVRRGEPFGMEYRLLHHDGEYRWQLTRALPLKNELGKVVRWFGSCTDIHDQKIEQAAREELAIRERAASESSRLKSEFLASMSHEVRTPVSGVIGMTALLLETPLKDHQRAYAEAIRTSGEALLTVINDILDLSKIEAGKLDFEDDDFSLVQTIEDAWLTVKHLAHKKELGFTLHCDESLPAQVRGDAGRLRQVVTNLLSNAVKFTLEGSITVKMVMVSRNSSAVKIRVDVTDTGIGVAPDAQARLFQPFSQADSSMSRRFGGTGLGLSISRRLVQYMGGEIGMESEEGKGANFWFTVSLKSAGEEGQLRSLPGQPSERVFRGRILIADDMQINQIIARRMVEKLGHSTHAVESGAQVLEALRQEKYDLVLMDCQMPGMDGYEAAALIRASKDIANPQVPIIAMTANVMRGEKEKCLAVGMNAYVSKPIDETLLATAINQWLYLERRDRDVA